MLEGGALVHPGLSVATPLVVAFTRNRFRTPKRRIIRVSSDEILFQAVCIKKNARTHAHKPPYETCWTRRNPILIRPGPTPIFDRRRPRKG